MSPGPNYNDILVKERCIINIIIRTMV